MKTLLLFPMLFLIQVTALCAQTLSEVRHLIVQAPALSGEIVDPGDLDGKPVVVAFFASWCPPCRTEFMALNQVLERTHEPVAIVAVNIFEQEIAPRAANSRLTRFLKNTAPQFSVIGNGEAIAEALGGIDRIPNVFVFKSDGRLGYRFIHRRNAQKMSISADDLLQILENFDNEGN